MKQVRAQLGNDIAIRAFREGKLRSRTAQSLPRCIGMRSRRKKTTKSWPLAFLAPASNLPLPSPPRMFSSWSRTQRSTRRLAAGDLPTSRMANLATRTCTKLASPVTSLPKIATTSSPVTRLCLEPKHAAPSCPLLALSGHELVRCTCPLLTQSGHRLAGNLGVNS